MHDVPGALVTGIAQGAMIALVALGYSLWRDQRAPSAAPLLNPVSSQLEAVGAK